MSLDASVSLLLAVLAGIEKAHTWLALNANDNKRGRSHTNIPGFLSHPAHLQHGDAYGGRIFLCKDSLVYLRKFDIDPYHVAALSYVVCSTKPYGAPPR